MVLFGLGWFVIMFALPFLSPPAPLWWEDWGGEGGGGVSVRGSFWCGVVWFKVVRCVFSLPFPFPPCVSPRYMSVTVCVFMFGGRRIAKGPGGSGDPQTPIGQE